MGITIKCEKCKSKNIGKTKEGYVCNECGYEFSTIEPTITDKAMINFKEKLFDCSKYFKGINSKNFKQKLFNGKMIIRYICVFAFVLSVIIFYNKGKSDAYECEYLTQKSEYQELINQTAENQALLKKQKSEIVSYSDLLNEIHSFENNKKEKYVEIYNLETQIDSLNGEKTALSNEANRLKEEIKDLKAEKKKLTGEIAKAKGKGYILTAGLYYGGDDIPVGTYNIEWVSGSGNVFVGQYTKGDIVNEIFGKDSSWGYIKTYKNAYVGDGTEIEIRSNLKVRFKAKD